MPYSSLNELPSAVKKLPKQAQEIFMNSFNSAYEQYKGDEEKAFSVAWSAVKKAGYKDVLLELAKTDLEPQIYFVSKHYEVIDKDVSGKKERFFEVPISGLDFDSDGEAMSEKALDQMIEQLRKGIPLHSNHGNNNGQAHNYRWQDIMGKSVDGWRQDNLLIGKFKCNMAHPEHDLFWDYMDQGMPVGFSIGAQIKEAHYEELDEK